MKIKYYIVKMKEDELSILLTEIGTSLYGAKIVKLVEGPTYQNEVAKKLGVAAGTIQRPIKKFFKLGIFERLNGLDGTDSRKDYFKLSEKGIEVRKRLE